MPVLTKARSLTSRDVALLRDTGKDGLASFGYLKKCYWPQAQPATCRYRLKQLVAAGYLTSRHIDHRKPGELVFFLTSVGQKLLSRPERDRFFRAHPKEYKQQLLAQDTRLALSHKLALEGHHLIDWQHEHEIRAEWASARGFLNKGSRRGSTAFSKTASSDQSTELPDCRAVARDAQGQLYSLDIEIESGYHRDELARKLAGLVKQAKGPVIWATYGKLRAVRIASNLPAGVELLLLDETLEAKSAPISKGGQLKPDRTNREKANHSL